MMFVRDDDVLIRTQFINNCPETYIEKEYAPYYGGDVYEETNREHINAPVRINDVVKCVSKETPVYAGHC